MKFIKLFENFEIDTILDKIAKSGEESLSKYEKDILDDYSNHLNAGNPSSEFNTQKYNYDELVFCFEKEYDVDNYYIYIMHSEDVYDEYFDSEKEIDIKMNGIKLVDKYKYEITKDIKDIIYDLTSLGIKYDTYFQSLIDDSIEIDGDSGIQYMIENYPDSIN